MKIRKSAAALIAAVILSASACSGSSGFKPISGFSDETNIRIEKFLKDTATEKGRKVAVFDGDGTVFGQAPHYLADECMYDIALKNPAQNPHVIKEIVKHSNVSLPYVQMRVHFFKGVTAESLRDAGDRCFRELYSDKIYPQMKQLTALLKNNGFEVWIVTASPELMYQRFLSRELGIPATNIVGVKSVIHGGVITDEIVKPVPQDHGKKEAIETFVQEVPLFSGGNSRGDKEMIEYSRGIRMIINPDEFTAPDQKESIAEYARRNGWLIERIKDVPSKGFPSVTSNIFKVKTNKSNE
jgi:phosphoserine phosphatase